MQHGVVKRMQRFREGASRQLWRAASGARVFKMPSRFGDRAKKWKGIGRTRGWGGGGEKAEERGRKGGIR